jgi:SAM-dependent methyltransferase
VQFTGERVVPGAPGCERAYQEHMARYMFASEYTSGKLVLDAGCGTGYGSGFLAREGARCVVGIDISPDAIDYSRRFYGGSKATFLVMDCTKLGFPPAGFDVVVSLEVIEHLADFRSHVAEARRVLTPGGMLVISTPNRLTYTADMPEPWNPFHVREFAPKEFEQLLAEHFHDVKLYGQRVLAAYSVAADGPTPPSRGRTRTVQLIPQHHDRPADAIETSLYLIAVCLKEAFRDEAVTPPQLGRPTRRGTAEAPVYMAATALEVQTASDDAFHELGRRLHELGRRLQETEAHAAGLQEHLQAILASKTWRIAQVGLRAYQALTAPLRALTAAVGKTSTTGSPNHKG